MGVHIFQSVDNYGLNVGKKASMPKGCILMDNIWPRHVAFAKPYATELLN